MIKTIAILGRPNVGKSTLFNALINRNEAIISPNPGMTRDRTYSYFEPDVGKKYLLIDTGGIILNSGQAIADKVNIQVNVAIEEADLLLFVVDARSGLLPLDIEISTLLRKTNKPILLVINKSDDENLDIASSEFYSLGFEHFIAVSAQFKRNISGIIDSIHDFLPESDYEENSDILRLCIVGRPNVGKSTLVNQIVGQERMIVDSVPGTTRNPAKCYFEINGRPWEIIDMAGIWRRNAGKEEEEIISMIAARREIERANACIFMLDLTQELSFQDSRLAGWIIESATPLVIAGNKVDLVEYEKEMRETYFESLKSEMPFLGFASFVIISAKEGKGIKKVFSELDKVIKNSFKHVSQEELDVLLEKLLIKRPPPKSANVRPVVISLYQEKVNPPTFKIRINHHRIDKIPKHWKNYVRNAIMKEFGYYGVPISVEYRKHKPNKSIKIRRGKIV